MTVFTTMVISMFMASDASGAGGAGGAGGVGGERGRAELASAAATGGRVAAGGGGAGRGCGRMMAGWETGWGRIGRTCGGGGSQQASDHGMASIGNRRCAPSESLRPSPARQVAP